ncbi:MAG: asparagine synthetase B, partial [Acidobacteriota bacterium]|nr:asparagine synthetase B [Acidobacteriota bacterium]
MCGIAGWANLDKNKFSHENKTVLHRMCERMKHRGPDSEGLWTDESVALGMRRLSIIDLHTGEQPVY